MRHSIYRITGFKLVGPYSLQVMFEDGIERTVDLEGVLEGEVYGPLKDRQLFAQAYLDPETHTIVWPNGADFDPETLYETFRDALGGLPDDVLLLPGHAYLANNLRFTLDREPSNSAATAMLSGLGADGTVPLLTLGQERTVNTFFRLGSEEVVAGLQRAFPGRVLATDRDRFVALRELRNRW